MRRHCFGISFHHVVSRWLHGHLYCRCVMPAPRPLPFCAFIRGIPRCGLWAGRCGPHLATALLADSASRIHTLGCDLVCVPCDTVSHVCCCRVPVWSSVALPCCVCQALARSGWPAQRRNVGVCGVMALTPWTAPGDPGQLPAVQKSLRTGWAGRAPVSVGCQCCLGWPRCRRDSASISAAC